MWKVENDNNNDNIYVRVFYERGRGDGHDNEDESNEVFPTRIQARARTCPYTHDAYNIYNRVFID